MGLPSWTYTPDGEGRAYTVSASSGQNPLSSTVYNSFGEVTGLSFGSLDSDSFTYDPNTGRMTQYQYNVNGSSLIGNLAWNANGTFEQLAITDPFTASNTQTCNNSYDDLIRLTSNNCGSAWNQSFSYDAFGNIASSGSLSFQPTYNLATNQYSTIPGTTPSYDANGNITNDGFHTYSWDAEGRNAYVTAGVPITYDALGRWVDQYYVQAIYAPTGFKLATLQALNGYVAHLPLPGGAFARYNYTGLDHYMHPDWLGTIRLDSSVSRVADADMAFSPFGHPYIGAGFDSFFTGVAETSEEATDLWTFPARNDHPTQAAGFRPTRRD